MISSLQSSPSPEQKRFAPLCFVLGWHQFEYTVLNHKWSHNCMNKHSSFPLQIQPMQYYLPFQSPLYKVLLQYIHKVFISGEIYCLHCSHHFIVTKLLYLGISWVVLLVVYLWLSFANQWASTNIGFQSEFVIRPKMYVDVLSRQVQLSLMCPNFISSKPWSFKL